MQQLPPIPTPLDPSGMGHQPGVGTAAIMGVGACGGAVGDRNALTTQAFGTTYVSAASVLGGAITVAVQSLDVTAGGIGDTVAAWPGGQLTEFQTNFYKTGALVTEDCLFVIQGQCFLVQKPGLLSGTTMTYPAWLAHYEPQLRDSVLNGFANNFQFGESGCNLKLGPLVLWPAMGGSFGASIVSNGNPTAGVYVPYRRACIAGGRNSSIQLVSTIASFSAQVISEDPGGPVLVTTAEVRIPVQQQLYGYVISRKGADFALFLAALSESDRQSILSMI